MPIKILLFFCLTLIPTESVFAEFIIIVNRENPIDQISVDELKNVYMMKKRTWADGTQILPLDLPKKSVARKSFSDIILKKTPSKMAKYYFKRALSGRGQPPKTYITEEKIVDFINRNIGAIGYVSKTSAAVKTIKVVKNR